MSSSLIQLVAQREALVLLEGEDPKHLDLFEEWLVSLTATQRHALSSYDQMVAFYKVTAQAAGNSTHTTH